MQKTLLLDCDGPLLDFEHMMFELVLGRDVPTGMKGWDTLKSYLTDDESKQVRRTLSDSDVWGRARPIEGAQRFVDESRQSGWGVYIVTSPWHGNPKFEWYRRQWLRKHFNIGPREVIFAHAKWLVQAPCNSEAVFIDDKPDHVKLWSEHKCLGHQAFLYDDGRHLDDESWAADARVRFPVEGGADQLLQRYAAPFAAWPETFTELAHRR